MGEQSVTLLSNFGCSVWVPAISLSNIRYIVIRYPIHRSYIQPRYPIYRHLIRVGFVGLFLLGRFFWTRSILTDRELFLRDFYRNKSLLPSRSKRSRSQKSLITFKVILIEKIFWSNQPAPYTMPLLGVRYIVIQFRIFSLGIRYAIASDYTVPLKCFLITLVFWNLLKIVHFLLTIGSSLVMWLSQNNHVENVVGSTLPGVNPIKVISSCCFYCVFYICLFTVSFKVRHADSHGLSNPGPLEPKLDTLIIRPRR